jgi:hypothetical protein
MELRVDAGTLACKKCERGENYKKPHHPTCEKSRKYKFNCGGPPPSARAMADENTAKNNLKKNGRKLAPNERGGQTNPVTRAHGEAFFEPRVGTGTTTPTVQDTST